MKIIGQILFNLFLALDQLLNTLLLGHPDETLSSRLGRTINKERYFFIKPFRILVDYIFFFDSRTVFVGKDRIPTKIRHCQKSIMPLEQQNFREMIDYEIWTWNKKER